VFYPKRTAKPLYQGLTTQCQKMNVTFIDELPSADTIDSAFDVVVDALFGFSFKGAPRPPFDTVLATLSQVTKPLVSVDIPSGKFLFRICTPYKVMLCITVSYVLMSLFGLSNLNGFY